MNPAGRGLSRHSTNPCSSAFLSLKLRVAQGRHGFPRLGGSPPRQQAVLSLTRAVRGVRAGGAVLSGCRDPGVPGWWLWPSVPAPHAVLINGGGRCVVLT